MPLLISIDLESKAVVVVVMMFAWFLQLGLHEGGHAMTAHWLGDPLPRMMGKVTFNPFKIIDWRDINYVISAVILPIVTILAWGFPMGAAWVWTGRYNTLHNAKVAIAGPIGSLAAALLGLGVWLAVYPLLHHAGDALVGLVSLTCFAVVLVGLVTFVLNLFPIPPLDGSEVLYHYLPPGGRQFMDAIRPYGFFIFIGIFWILPRVTNGRVDIFGLVFNPLFTRTMQFMAEAPVKIWG